MCREELHWKLCGQNSSSRTLLHSSSVHAVNQPLFDSRCRLQRDRQSKRSPGRLNIPTYFLTYLLRRSSSGSPLPRNTGRIKSSSWYDLLQPTLHLSSPVLSLSDLRSQCLAMFFLVCVFSSFHLRVEGGGDLLTYLPRSLIPRPAYTPTQLFTQDTSVPDSHDEGR